MKAGKAVAFVSVALVLAFAFLLLLFLFRGGSSSNNAAPASKVYLFAVNGRPFDITLVAANVSSREKGLMNATITNTTLMVFVFPVPGIYPFWMKNTYPNLDMMWLNVSGGSGEVVYLVRNATSCVGESLGWCESNIYMPDADANYVIEAKAGFAEANNITVGTRVELSGTG